MYRFITDLRQDIIADDERREMLAASHRRLVECMCSKDLEGGYTAIDMHFSLIDSRLNVRPRSDQA
jgi:DNA-binding FadR family transcriptional regulator